MDTVFLLIIFAFVVFGFFSGGKKKTRTLTRLQALAAKNNRVSSSPQNTRNRQHPQEKTQVSGVGQTVQTITAKEALRLARLAKAGLERGQRSAGASRHNGNSLSDSDRSRDVVDKNTHRRTDWGARAGPGVLSSRNLLILVAISLALMVLSQIPSHVFR